MQRKQELLKKIEDLEVKLNLDAVDLTSGLPPKMQREEAERYYNDRLRRYWMEAGYYKKGCYPAHKWIEYWVEKAYKKGLEDGKNLNEKKDPK